LQTSKLEVWCLGEGETVHRDALAFTKISAGKDLDLGRRERGIEKKMKSFIQNEISESIAFGAELSRNPLLSLRSFCKMEVLPAGSFSPLHRQRMSFAYSQLKKELRSSHPEVKVHTLSYFLLSIVLAHLY